MHVHTHAPLWGEVFQPMIEIPDLVEQYEVKFSNPHDWNSLIEQFLFPANEQKLWFQCHWPYSFKSNFSSRQMSKNYDFNIIGGIVSKIFVKLGKIKFKVFF